MINLPPIQGKWGEGGGGKGRRHTWLLHATETRISLQENAGNKQVMYEVNCPLGKKHYSFFVNHVIPNKLIHIEIPGAFFGDILFWGVLNLLDCNDYVEVGKLNHR